MGFRRSRISLRQLKAQAAHTMAKADSKLDDAGELVDLAKRLVVLAEGTITAATDLIEDLQDDIEVKLKVGDNVIPVSLIIDPSEEESTDE